MPTPKTRRRQETQNLVVLEFYVVAWFVSQQGACRVSGRADYEAIPSFLVDGQTAESSNQTLCPRARRHKSSLPPGRSGCSQKFRVNLPVLVRKAAEHDFAQ